MILCQHFHAHSALALSLLALIAGAVLCGKSCTEQSGCQKMGKILGGFVMLLSLFSTICILYLSIMACYQKNGGAMMGCDRCAKHGMQHGDYHQGMQLPEGWKHPPLSAPEGNAPKGDDGQ
ncbi:MAG: hypothetical protein HYV02_05475 [Deltaproteobacteria bacterium]|nr:hypothetical protein [Deltaproteobacteria bacterium]